MGKKGVTVITVLSVLFSLVMIFLSIFLFRMLRGDVRETSKDPADYGDWSLSEEYTKLLVFPAEIPDSAVDVEYYYQYESGYTRPMCQIYLHCRLDDRTFDSEVERLKSLSYTSEKEGTKTVRNDRTSFVAPAFVTMEGYDFCYEYAVVDETEKKIVYVFAMNTMEDDIYFDKTYLPDYFMEDFTEIKVDGLDRFTMYERFRDG